MRLWDDAQMDALSEQLGILFGNSSPRNHHQPIHSPSTFSPSDLCAPTRQVGRHMTPAFAGALPWQGGDGMGTRPSQMSDSQKGLAIWSVRGTSQAPLGQMWLDPAEWLRKPIPGSLHLVPVLPATCIQGQRKMMGTSEWSGEAGA